MNALPNIDKFRKRAGELEAELANPAVYSDQRRAGDLARELQHLKKLLGNYSAAEAVQKQMAENKELIASGDTEMAELARGELDDLQRKLEKLYRDVQLGLVVRARAAMRRLCSRETFFACTAVTRTRNGGRLK